MDISALKVVLLVAQQPSIAAAARVLDIDASRVSRTVSQVEREIGFRLFQRSTRSLSITEDGALYLSRIAPLVEELDAARDAATMSHRSPAGTLRMTASVSLAQECLIPHLAAFGESYPDVVLELQATDVNLDLLSEGIDLAIRLTPKPVGDLIATRLMSTRYRVVAAPEYLSKAGVPSHPTELTQHNCLRFALPGFRGTWRFRDADMTEFDVHVGGKFLISNALVLREAARHAMGPCLLADWLVGRDLQEGRLVDVFPDFCCTSTVFETGAWALYPSRVYVPRKVRVMIEFLRSVLRAHPREISAKA